MNKYSSNIFYLSNTLPINTQICQYLRLDYLIEIIRKNKYLITQKRIFEDQSERKFSINLTFSPTPAVLNSEQDHTMIIDNQQDKAKQYKHLCYNYVSCWTAETTENILMWKGYGSVFGACIRSNLNNFVASFDSTDFGKFDVYCAPINYRFQRFADAPEDCIFRKDPYYKDEKEIRFIFMPKDETIKDSNKKIQLSINPRIMVEEIILSPYISKDAALFLADVISSTSNIPVSLSRIKLNK